MAISYAHYRLMVQHRKLLPRGGHVLQIGDANWYGDAEPLVMLELADTPDERAAIRRAAETGDQFAQAKAFYDVLFAPKLVISVDANGSEGSLRLDLNEPVKFNNQFDLAVNHGTAEHVFNISQVFRTIHDAVKPGGLMIHESPCYGWPDHGFYCLQPTLFYDLAHANGYEMVSLSLMELSSNTASTVADRNDMHRIIRHGLLAKNTCLFVVMRKLTNAEFKVPMQGVYDGTLSEAGKDTWQEAR